MSCSSIPTTSLVMDGHWACCCERWHRCMRRFPPNGPSPLPELPVQYADFAAWQREFLAGRSSGQAACVLEASNCLGLRPAWNCRRTARGRRCRIVSGCPASDRASERIARVPAEAEPRGRSDPVHDLAGGLRCAAFALFSGQQDVVRRYPDRRTQSRRSRGADRLLCEHAGACAPTCPATPRFANCSPAYGKPLWAPLRIRTCRSKSWWRNCRPERDLSRNPLIQVIFALQNVPAEGTRIAGLETIPFSTGTQSAKLDLTLAVTEVSEGLHTAAVDTTPIYLMRRRLSGCCSITSAFWTAALARS